MPNISTYLDNIRSATYGSEVRSSIVASIEQCYSDVNSPSLNVAAFEAAVNNKIQDGTLQNMTIPNGSIGPEKLSFSIDVSLTSQQKSEIIGLLDDDTTTT